NCKTPISFRYAAVELLTGALFLLCYWHLFPIFVVTAGAVPSEYLIARVAFLPLIKCCTFAFLILGLIFIDAEHQLLPDKLTIPGMVLGFLFSLFGFVPGFGRGTEFGGLAPPAWLISFVNAAIGALVGALFIYLAGEIYFRVRGIEGMGFGDVKLMAMVGAFLGWQLVLFTIFTASLFGSVVGIGMMLGVYASRPARLAARP